MYNLQQLLLITEWRLILILIIFLSFSFPLELAEQEHGLEVDVQQPIECNE